MAITGTLLGKLSSDPSIAGMGGCIGRGTMISIVTVLLVLPQLLLLGEKLIDVSSFSMNSPIQRSRRVGFTRIDGVVTGEISGRIHGIVHAYVDGEVDVNLVRGTVEDKPPEQKLLEKKGGNEHED